MQGVNKGDCVHKIVQKYGPRTPFIILKEKTYQTPGIFGFFSREKMELEYYLPPIRGLQSAPSETEAYVPVSADRTATMSAASSTASSRDDSTLDFVEAKKRLLKAAGRDPDQVFQQVQEEQEEAEFNQQQILDKLRQIEEKLETGKETKTEHPNLILISRLLKQNDFSERYTAGILEKARKELPLETLEDANAVQDCVLGWIGESIKLFPIPEIPKSGRILVLIGPTGVGKTTTVAKLAAMYGILRRPPISVRIITVDAFRIGAKEQIADYSKIMEIPFSYIDNQRDLRREIDLYREEADLILVDTIGRSPKDSVKLGEMKELLDACGSKAEIHLVMSASTKTSDMEHILQQFEPFNYQAVMLTKLDETGHIGNVISALAERGKPLSYITDGQNVPKDIKRATVIRFLINLEDFRVDREAFEKRFPAAEADQLQWG